MPVPLSRGDANCGLVLRAASALPVGDTYYVGDCNSGPPEGSECIGAHRAAEVEGAGLRTFSDIGQIPLLPVFLLGVQHDILWLSKCSILLLKLYSIHY